MFQIEFIGIPGSGKTTLYRQLSRRLKTYEAMRFLSTEEAFLEVSRKKIDRVFRVLINILPQKAAIKMIMGLLNRTLMQFEAQNVFLSEHYKSFNAFLSSDELNTLTVDDRSKVISFFMEAASIYEVIQGQISPQAIVMFDEGLIQKSFMFVSHLRDRNKHNNHLYEYLEHIPHPDLLLCINTDVSISQKRMVHRPKGLTNRLKKANQKEISLFLKKSDEHVKNITDWFKNETDTHLIEFNNNDIDGGVRELENRVINVIGNHSKPI